MTLAATGGARPRLVFFQWNHQPNAKAAKFLLLHMQHHVKCLAVHFDVIVVNEDCDYAEICDRYQPDMALFEAGYRSHGSRRIRVSNTGAHPSIPKAGLHNADAWCDRRSGFLSDMDRWGIETFFAICTTTPAYTPGMADRTFAWPSFIDPELFRDYGQDKTIPIAMTGQLSSLYPWRKRIYPVLRDNYPCLTTPPFAYESRAAQRLLTGESYARALNASHFALSCGTMAGEVVRKHFEIPAAGACLLAERTPAVEAAGFVDGENCVFADGEDALDRIDHLFAHPEDLSRITAAGQKLVMERHTLRHRPQIYQWYSLVRQLAPGQRIVQLGPFEDLIAVDRASGVESIPVQPLGLDRAELAAGARHLAAGRIDEAEACYRRALDFVPYLPEGKLGLALCALHRGAAEAAADLLVGLIEVATVEYGAAEPDPVDWAYFLLTLICRNRIEEARAFRDFYAGLEHPELARVRALLARLDPRASAPRPTAAAARRSVHVLPERSEAEWQAWAEGLLLACGRDRLVARLRGRAEPAPQSRPAPRRWYWVLERLLRSAGPAGLQSPVPPSPDFQYLGRLGLRTARLVLRGRARDAARRLRDRLRPARAAARSHS